MSNDLAVKTTQLTNAVKQMSDYLKGKIDDNTTQINDIVKSVVGNTYNAFFYGLKTGEEGKATNSNKMQELINLASSNGGGKIYIPQGTYYFDKKLMWKSNISLVGDGIDKTVLKTFGGTAEAKLTDGYPLITAEIAGTVAETAEVNNCMFKDFTIDGSELYCKYTVNAKGLFIIRMNNCIFRDIKFYGTGSTALGCDYLNNSFIDHIICEKCGISRFQKGCAGIGIGTKGLTQENLIITNCICKECYNYGIFVETQEIFKGDEALKDFDFRGVIIANCVTHDCTHAGFGIKGGNNVMLSSCVSYKNEYGIELGCDLKNIKVDNCIIQENTSHGIYVVDGYDHKEDGKLYFAYDIDGIHITNNDIYLNGGDGINFYQLPVNDSHPITVHSHRMTNNIYIKNNNINKNSGAGVHILDRTDSTKPGVANIQNFAFKGNEVLANGKEGFISDIMLRCGSFSGNTITKNNVSNTSGLSNCKFNCDLTNINVAYNDITDGKDTVSVEYNIEFVSGKTISNCIVNHNILNGYKTGAVLSTGITKSGYTEIQVS